VTRLQLSFLGAYRASQAGAGEITFTNRKVVGLLAFLALEAGQAHSRETLMGLFWPEMSEAGARNNLRVTLARLRKQLEGVTAVSPLTATRRDVRLQLGDTISLDAADFLALLAESESHTHADRSTCTGCRQRLTAAAVLYHGPLLHGLYLDDCPAFDEWLFVQRERFHLQALEVLEELAQGLAADGRFAEATTHTRRQLELDRCTTAPSAACCGCWPTRVRPPPPSASLKASKRRSTPNWALSRTWNCCNWRSKSRTVRCPCPTPARPKQYASQRQDNGRSPPQSARNPHPLHRPRN
jgi:DNA-binding SARP family transcriptional activator